MSENEAPPPPPPAKAEPETEQRGGALGGLTSRVEVSRGREADTTTTSPASGEGDA